MMTCDTPHLVDSIAFPGWSSSSVDGRNDSRRGEASATNPLEQLVQLRRSNDRLVVELKQARRRLGQAMEFAGDPKSGGNLAITLVVHTRKNHTRVLKQLRANRLQALELLAQLAVER